MIEQKSKIESEYDKVVLALGEYSVFRHQTADVHTSWHDELNCSRSELDRLEHRFHRLRKMLRKAEDEWSNDLEGAKAVAYGYLIKPRGLLKATIPLPKGRQLIVSSAN